MLSFFLSLYLGLFAQHVASSPDATAIARGRGQLRIGVQMYETGDVAGAMFAFERSYKLFPINETLFNLALCHFRLGNTYAARGYLRQYLEELRKSSGEKTPNNFARNLDPKVSRLEDQIMVAVDEDYGATGLDFACSQKVRICSWNYTSARPMGK